MSRSGQIDWSVLSGPRVSRRTLMKLAGATGAAGFASTLALQHAARAAAPARLQDPQQGGTLRLGFVSSQIVTLDPGLLAQGVVAGSVLPSLHSSLVQFDEGLGLIPDLAETWEVSEDGLQYTFTLREGLTFHNGDSLTSADFLYTYERTTNPDFASPHANKLALITDFQTPDELTVTLTMSEPFAPFLAVACTRGPGRALTPISQRAIEEMGDEQFGMTPVGSGPFMMDVDTFEVGTGFDMVPFEAWYGGRPYLDRIELRLVPEPSSAVSGLEAGDLDIIDPAPATAFEQMEGNPDLVVMQNPSTSWRGVAMNYNNPPWDNPDARRAVSMAIDRQAFVDTAFFGLATPSVGPIAPAFGWAYIPPDEIENPQVFDLEQAQALAESAGIVGLQPVIISSEEIGQRPTEVLRTALTEIGLDPQVDFQQAATFNERWQSGDYDMFLHGSQVDADPDDGFWNFFYSDGPWNTYGYADERTDELLEATRSVAGQGERAQLFQELQAHLSDTMVMAFVYHVFDLVAFSNAVQGLVPIPEQRYYEQVWLDQ